MTTAVISVKRLISIFDCGSRKSPPPPGKLTPGNITPRKRPPRKLPPPRLGLGLLGLR